jgi:hypothetical protein
MLLLALAFLTSWLWSSWWLPPFEGFMHAIFAIPAAVTTVLAACWVGMWFATRQRKPIGAVALTTALVIGFQWVSPSLHTC